MTPLRIPTVLAFTVIGAAAGAIGACGDDARPPVDAACVRYCVYQSVDNGNCPPPTCATGSNSDQCPAGCVPMA